MSSSLESGVVLLFLFEMLRPVELFDVVRRSGSTKLSLPGHVTVICHRRPSDGFVLAAL